MMPYELREVRAEGGADRRDRRVKRRSAPSAEDAGRAGPVNCVAHRALASEVTSGLEIVVRTFPHRFEG
jgi:hypothetical protein